MSRGKDLTQKYSSYMDPNEMEKHFNVKNGLFSAARGWLHR